MRDSPSSASATAALAQLVVAVPAGVDDGEQFAVDSIARWPLIVEGRTPASRASSPAARGRPDCNASRRPSAPGWRADATAAKSVPMPERVEHRHFGASRNVGLLPLAT